MKLFITVYVIAWIVLACVIYYPMDRDLDSVIDRAQVAADRDDMLKDMLTLKKNMQDYNATSGHTALIFKNPVNDMGRTYQAIERHIQRLEGIKSWNDISSMSEGTQKTQETIAYNGAMDDMRGAIRELPNPANGLFWIQYIWWMLLVGIFGFIVSIVYEAKK